VEEFSTREANLLYLQEPKNHICLPFCDFCKWRYKGQADKGPCGLNFLPFCFIDCSNLAQSMNIHQRLYVLFIFHRRQAYSDLAAVDYKCIKDSVIQNLIMSLNKKGIHSFEAERSKVCSFCLTNIFCQFAPLYRACV